MATEIIVCENASCSIDAAFDTDSYLALENIDMKNNFYRIPFTITGEKDIHIHIIKCIIAENLDVSLSNINKLEIKESTLNISKTLAFDNINEVKISETVVESYDQDEITTDVVTIGNSDVNTIDVDINLTMEESGYNRINGLSLDKTFVKELDLNFDVKYIGNAPPPVTDAKWLNVSPSESRSLAIKDDNTLWGAGKDTVGAFGIGVYTYNQKTFKQLGSDSDWWKVKSGFSFSLAIKTDGTLWATGSNNQGQLGLGDQVDRDIWEQVGTDTNWVDISPGQIHSMALKSDGTMWVTGNNTFGQLGMPATTGFITTFQDPTGFTDWKHICSSYSFSSHGIRDNGVNDVLYASGYNNRGQLGDGTATNSFSFIQVTNINTTELAVMDSSTVILVNSGSGMIMKSTGDNFWGQLGIGNEIVEVTFQQEATNYGFWNKISSGYFCSYALRDDGSLWAVGNNDYGQLGLGDQADRNLYTRVGSDTDWVFIGGGGHALFVIKSDGTMWATGKNTFGQLGINQEPLQPITTLTKVVIT